MGVGPAAAVGGAAVQVVAVVVALGQRREQVADGEVMGLVQSQFRRRQGLVRLEGGASRGTCVHVEGQRGCGHHCPATVRVKNINRRK